MAAFWRNISYCVRLQRVWCTTIVPLQLRYALDWSTLHFQQPLHHIERIAIRLQIYESCGALCAIQRPRPQTSGVWCQTKDLYALTGFLDGDFFTAREREYGMSA